jgi:hypothetical protein
MKKLLWAVPALCLAAIGCGPGKEPRVVYIKETVAVPSPVAPAPPVAQVPAKPPPPPPKDTAREEKERGQREQAQRLIAERKAKLADTIKDHNQAVEQYRAADAKLRAANEALETASRNVDRLSRYGNGNAVEFGSAEHRRRIEQFQASLRAGQDYDSAKQIQEQALAEARKWKDKAVSTEKEIDSLREALRRAEELPGAPTKDVQGLPPRVDETSKAFVGRWKLVDRNGVPSSYATISDSLIATKDHAPDATGRIEIVGNDARITWTDGFRDIWRLEGGAITVYGLGRQAPGWDAPALFQLNAVRMK